MENHLGFTMICFHMKSARNYNWTFLTIMNSLISKDMCIMVPNCQLGNDPTAKNNNR